MTNEHGLVRESDLREQNVKSDFPVLPDGVNGGSGHVVVVGALGVGGEDQQVAAVHALQGDLGFAHWGFSNWGGRG